MTLNNSKPLTLPEKDMPGELGQNHLLPAFNEACWPGPVHDEVTQKLKEVDDCEANHGLHRTTGTGISASMSCSGQIQ